MSLKKIELNRREFTARLLGAAALGFAACTSQKGGGSESGDTNTRGEGDSAGGGSDSAGGDSAASGEWATGGTASMSGDYPDPFADKTDASCALTCALTLGPCYAETPERQDVSEGVSGLPTRLAFKVVDEDCQPVEGALVEIWHCAPSGLYSGEDAAEMCTEGDSEATSGHWFRGGQTTDAEGRVDFNTCFPGWYSSRAVHIHLRVVFGGSEYVVSQLFFASELIEEIFDTHPEYVGYGQPDTSNSEDDILGDEDPEAYICEYAKMSDGALQAWKTLVIRSSLSSDLCGA